ncbi:hypothetical protein IGI04_023217, partial [Brassica rapa subsp. trilocularis]
KTYRDPLRALGIDYSVDIEASEDGKTLETVRPGYCGAYNSHFQDGGHLSFPLPRFLLEALAELGMAFAQMAPNFWCYFLTSWIRAREEGIRFGLEELKQLFSVKRNSGFPGTMILSPRPVRSVIDEPFAYAPMSPELHGLIATLQRGENRATPVGSVVPVRPGKGRRDKRAREKEVLPDRPDESSEVGSLERAQKTRRGPTLRSRSQTQSPGLLARPVSIAIPVGGARRAPNTSSGSLGDQALDDEIDSPLTDADETSSWRFSYNDEVPILENPEGLALIWRKIIEKGCELPPLDDMRERDAYVRMVVANVKAMEASNEYTALMEKRLADFPSKEEVGGHLLTIQQLRGELETIRVTEKQREVEVEGLKGKLENHRREIEGCKAKTLKERSLARRSLAQEYDMVLAVVKDNLRKKKEETAAEFDPMYTKPQDKQS